MGRVIIIAHGPEARGESSKIFLSHPTCVGLVATLPVSKTTCINLRNFSLRGWLKLELTRMNFYT